jgi:hypothetical protein
MPWPLNDSDWIWWITALSASMFVGTLILIPFLVVRIPEDYFVRRPVRDWPSRHPLVHLLLVVLKNLLGATLLLLGLVLLILPGQGLLTILVGLVLLDFPGKRQCEARLIRVKPVLDAANWIRKRHGHPALRIDR